MPPPWPETGELARLDAEESNHALRALRVRAGDWVRLVDGSGQVTLAEVISEADAAREAAANGVIRHPKGSARAGRTDILSVRLGSVTVSAADGVQAGRVCIPWIRTPSRMDWILEKATELGAVAFDIYFADHSAKSDSRQVTKKLQRWERITKSAMKQSDRAFWPRVTFHESLAALLDTYASASVIIADPTGKRETAAGVIASPKERLLIVGAEGGWSDEEQRLLSDRSPVVLSLGPARLRVETAAVVLCAKFCLEVPEA
jgi:16S rRNA (uracil1498-N3)-methyltransferase